MSGVLRVLVKLMLSMFLLSNVALAETKKNCEMSVYQLRTPIIMGCQITVTNKGVKETFTVSQDGTVFTGWPSDKFKKSAKTINKCPGELGKSDFWRETKKQQKSAYKKFKTSPAGKISIQHKGNNPSSGLFTFMGKTYEFADAKKDRAGFYTFIISNGHGVFADGSYLKLSIAKTASLSVVGDMGAVDFRGRCE